MATTEELQAQFQEVIAADGVLRDKMIASTAATAALTTAQGTADGARAETELARADLSAKVAAFKDALDSLDD